MSSVKVRTVTFVTLVFAATLGCSGQFRPSSFEAIDNSSSSNTNTPCPTTSSGGSRWLTSSGNANTDKARKWVAQQNGLRVNIERARYYLGDFTSGTQSYTTLKSQGVAGVRLFYPWRHSIDMAGIGKGKIPTASQLQPILNATTNALKVGLYVQLDLMDVVGIEDTISPQSAAQATVTHIEKFADLIAATAAAQDWDMSKIAIGAANEWAGGDNPIYNDVRLKLHAILRQKLGPNAILVINPSGWGHIHDLNSQFKLPTDGGPLVAQVHDYGSLADVQTSNYYRSLQNKAIDWSNQNGGVPVILSEFGIWDGNNDNGYLTNPSLAIPMIAAAANGAPELRPAIWAITDGWYYVNKPDGTLLTSPNVADAFLSGTESIQRLANGGVAGNSTCATRPAPETSVAASGGTSIPIQSTSSHFGFSPDNTGSSFNWGFMTGIGAYLEYSVNIASAGTYRLYLTYSTPLHSGLDVFVNGTKGGSLTLTSTGDWYDDYKESNALDLNLTAGSVKIRLVANRSQAFNILSLRLDSGASSSNPPPSSTPTPAPSPLPSTSPNSQASKKFLIVTAGQSNAGFRIDDGGLLRNSGWDWPLWSIQASFIKNVLGALDVGDTGDRYGGNIETAVGGCGLMRSAGQCHFVDDLSSSNPEQWMLSSVGLTLLNNIIANKSKGDVVFISWIQGEADAQAIASAGWNNEALPGHSVNGGPYNFSTREQWAQHYKEVLKRMLTLLRAQSALPQLRMAIQLIGSYQGATDQIRQAQIDAARESNGSIILSSANPWQWYRPNGSDTAHYSGESYNDFCLETARTISFAMRQAGDIDSLTGPGYGRFPTISEVAVNGATVDLIVSNPNGASTLILPDGANTAGFAVEDAGGSAAITHIALVAPFKIRLTLNRSVTSIAKVTYGREGQAFGAGRAITDNAASSSPPDAANVPRRNMPLMIKPT